ncbi:MAG: formate dehydrogenase accessory protein FdhE [Humidesulfovibrio sp.]|nr:formate dehydrogenase accessory protein FdhE [Humidesulfovibrio sp.]
MHSDDQVFMRLMQDKLAEIRGTDMLPEELVALVERVLPVQFQARDTARVTLPEASACAGTEAMFAGSPLILRENFPFDAEQALGLFQTLLELLAGTGGAAAGAAETLRAAIAAGELDPAQVLRALPAGDEALFAAWRQRLPGSPRALDFLATSALWPSLNAAALALAPRLPENLPHHQGHCPLCGSLPYVTLLRQKEGLRFGACSYCGHEYRLRRLACPYCDESDTAKLKIFRVAEYPGVVVSVCETCSMYAKTLDFRELDKTALPALDDMASVALDVLAQGQGYKRPTLSAWGF